MSDPIFLDVFLTFFLEVLEYFPEVSTFCFCFDISRTEVVIGRSRTGITGAAVATGLWRASRR